MVIDDNTKTILSDPDSRRAWVGFQLKLKGKTLAAVAREHDIDRTTLYSVFNGSYPRMERILEEELGVRRQLLFPERYLSDGSHFRRGEKGAA